MGPFFLSVCPSGSDVACAARSLRPFSVPFVSLETTSRGCNLTKFHEIALSFCSRASLRLRCGTQVQTGCGGASTWAQAQTWPWGGGSYRGPSANLAVVGGSHWDPSANLAVGWISHLLDPSGPTQSELGNKLLSSEQSGGLLHIIRHGVPWELTRVHNGEQLRSVPVSSCPSFHFPSLPPAPETSCPQDPAPSVGCQHGRPGTLADQTLPLLQAQLPPAKSRGTLS